MKPSRSVAVVFLLLVAHGGEAAAMPPKPAAKAAPASAIDAQFCREAAKAGIDTSRLSLAKARRIKDIVDGMAADFKAAHPKATPAVMAEVRRMDLEAYADSGTLRGAEADPPDGSAAACPR